MRSREAWLAAMTAVLGVSDVACKKDATEAPAAVREVPSASASAPVSVAASAPSETASVEAPIASASASAPPTIPSATAGIGLGNIGTIGHNLSCGARMACGASARQFDPQPIVNISIVNGGSAEEKAKVQTMLRSRFRACAANAVRSDPNVHGSATLQLTFDAHGTVTSVDPQSTDLPESIVACMKNAARGVKLADGVERTIRLRARIERSE